MTLYILAGSLALLIFWLMTGYLNYRKYKHDLIWFKTKHDFFMKMEMNAGHIPIKVDYFNQREALVHEYSFFYEEMKKIDTDTHYWHKTLGQYMLMGPLYNIT